jgi:NAD(P)-dependent dehydrogenase (short-subunit alcohol dehydrogenase family)
VSTAPSGASSATPRSSLRGRDDGEGVPAPSRGSIRRSFEGVPFLYTRTLTAGAQSPVGRAGTPDEVGAVGALLMGSDGAFITGSDFLMDGGVTASFFFGDLAPE